MDKLCNRCKRTFETGHLKSCPAMGKTCKNCNKPNHLAKMRSSQHVSETTEDFDDSEEWKLVMEIFGVMRRIRDNIATDNHANGGKDFEICQGENKGNKPNNELGGSTNIKNRST